ncbi:MAG TPA: ECF-type sigma factor [Bryobacteraceae bacterium]|jgi:RNA polymerase sigma factor (TIGR02999 family)|nr:ECF-type sigma factor [Bryobacteraceae bacterium]
MRQAGEKLAHDKLGIDLNESPSVTDLLHAWREGDRSALDRLVPLVYSNLRGMAAAHLHRESGSQTLDPTALVHEAYLRLVGDSDPEFQNRAHFLGVASRVMRQILVDRARARNAYKRQGGARVPLDDDLIFTGERAAMVVALDDALSDLERQDPEKARLLEMRYFGGMTAEDSAALLGVPLHKINRQMKLAQAWLRRELGPVEP